MTYPIVKPSILSVSKSCLAYEQLAIWQLPEFLGLETCAYLPGNVNHCVAHNIGQFTFWINDNGTAKALDPKTFGQQFPAYAYAALEAMTELQPWPFGEKMSEAYGLTEDGDNDSVLVVFTRHGAVSYAENLDMVIDDFRNEAINGFDSIEDAEDHLNDVLDTGKLCSFFKPPNLSAHEEVAW